MIFLILALAVAVPERVLAGPFQITDRTSDLDTSNPVQAVILEALNSAADNLENQINGEKLSIFEQNAFLGAMADASVNSTRGMGADYSSNYEYSIMGLHLALTFNLGSSDWDHLGRDVRNADNQFPGIGAAIQGGGLVASRADRLGIKRIGGLNVKRLKFNVNFFSWNLHDIGSVKFTFHNLGLHAQYKLVEPSKKMSVWTEWGGLDLTTGLDYATFEAKYSASMDISQDATIGETGESVTMRWNSEYSLGIETDTFSIPIELSTYTRFFYFLTLFGGGAVDLNVGSAKIFGEAQGPITASSTTGFEGNLFAGTGVLDYGDDTAQSPTAVDFRSFLGLQFNFWRLKLLSQFSWVSSGTYMLMSGLRVEL